MNLVTLNHPHSPAAEAYRTLRTNLHFATLDAPAKTIVVTSPSSGEDKSLAAANLAVVLAQAERRVALVDADLRRPSLHALLEAPPEPGLAEVLAGGAAVDVNAVVQRTGVPGLMLLPGGRATGNPSDLLDSSRMKAVLSALGEQADIVLLDAPPVLSASDAAILASQSDGVVLVITAGKTRRDQAQSAKEALLRARARLLGAVMLNGPKRPQWSRS
jgi:non-specific protein-tyrosine kinase